MGKKLTTNNNLEYLYPKIASGWNYKKNVLKPNEVFPHTNKKYWWICVFGHEYESSPNNRSQGKGCPYCSGQKAGYGNDIVSKFPDLIKDWDYGKNSKNPEQITPGSDYLAYWVCENNHSYRYKVSNRTRGQKGCRKCTNRDVANHNSLTYNYPELMKEWDYEKNTLNPKGLVFGTPKKVWWRCSKNHSWKTSINLRTSRNTSCPYCSGHRVSEKNNLLHNYPQIASEWDYEKNNDSPEDLPGRSSKKRWWICKNQHSYKSTVSNRTGGSGCPYCAGRSVGYGNDLKSIYPELCKEWDYEKNSKTPETLTPGSHYFARWICKKGHTWKTKVKNRC